MALDNYEHDNDARFDDKLQKRIGQPVKRAKASRRRSGKKVVGGSPGGIRERRNKRWSW